MSDAMQQLTQAETNRLIRADLKATHTGTTFTVRAANGAGITHTVIGWEIGYRPTSADFDGYYSPNTCALVPGPTESDIDTLAARYSSWEWTGDDGVRDHAADRLVATAPGQLPAVIHYGAGNVTARPHYRNLDL
ncbi:hypothetical protein [Arthrobacter sp. SO3]|uniref:hypothetical protein n=1 Tax=Arthrobacter sp. SO3 TaxID=1897057 RepID=UPI001CFFF1F5|nr:hypothetical protein [Arthrobacter sp. SO3]